ncbi:MAG: hypothetical protein ACOC4L_03750 [Halanaerobium sp.]
MNKKGQLVNILIGFVFIFILIFSGISFLKEQNLLIDFCVQNGYDSYSDYNIKDDKYFVECIKEETKETKLFYDLEIAKKCASYDKWGNCKKEKLYLKGDD